MLDYPPSAGGCEAIRGQWRAFEEMKKDGNVRTLAVSNFSPQQLDCILNTPGSTPPEVNQLQYSVGHGGDTAVRDNAARDVVVQAWSPLRSGALVRDTDCAAVGKKHGKSAAQVALRWILQHNATFTTQSRSRQHLQEDLELFDFEISVEDMALLDAKN